MELSVLYSRALAGIDAPLVQVETHLANGLPSFHIVGLPEAAVRESRDRVRCAIVNSHFRFPDRRITVNLAPADLPKEGGSFDLPIALGILIASGQLAARQPLGYEFLGELALDGGLRPIPGAVCASRAASRAGRCLVIPLANAPIAALVPKGTVLGSADLLTLCAHLNGNCPIAPTPPPPCEDTGCHPDLREVVGQQGARRALEIAAAGGHHLLLSGPPGTGKTLLASRLPGILPPPDPAEALEILALRHLVGPTGSGPDRRRPFRSPHHSASAAALCGGGYRPRPGEISLAHGGVLFLDELAEFSRHSLEALREPMEAGEITLSRARHKVRYPARFQLVAAMNPCPCGYLGDPERACRCTPEQVQRYRGRISGPLLDRIDLHVTVPRLPASALLVPGQPGEDSAAVRARVIRSRRRQMERQGCANAQLGADRLGAVCGLQPPVRSRLQRAAEQMQLSGRALHRTLRVARTVADLACSPEIADDHLCEALAYRDETQPLSGT